MYSKLIAEFDVFGFSDELIFHGTGVLDEDLKNIISCKEENRLLVAGRIFNNYVEVFDSTQKTIFLVNKIESGLLEMKEKPENFYLRVIDVLGKKILTTKELMLDKPLSTLLKGWYSKVELWDGELAAELDRYLGGYENVKKLFIYAD